MCLQVCAEQLVKASGNREITPFSGSGNQSLDYFTPASDQNPEINH